MNRCRVVHLTASARCKLEAVGIRIKRCIIEFERI